MDALDPFQPCNNQTPQSTFLPLTWMFRAATLVEGGSQLSGCLLKNGHGGTTTRKVRAVPAKPVQSVLWMSWVM